MGSKEIAKDLIDPTRMAKKHITLYALGTFLYGISLGVLVCFQFSSFFNNYIIVYTFVGILFLIGLVLVGPSYSKILRNYDIKERK